MARLIGSYAGSPIYDDDPRWPALSEEYFANVGKYNFPSCWELLGTQQWYRCDYCGRESCDDKCPYCGAPR